MRSTRARPVLTVFAWVTVLPLLCSAVTADRAGAPGVALQIQDVLSAKWRDGEIRSQYVAASRETDISLGLLPTGKHGTLTLVFSARLRERIPTEPPATIQVLAGAGLNVNPNVIRRPVLRFLADPGTQRATTIDASERLRLLEPDPGASIDNASATISLVEFIQLLRAEIITADIFGLEVSLSSKQRDSLRDFGMRALKKSR